MHNYADALRKSLLFFRAQRSGNLSDTANPILWRSAPCFLTDGADVGVDLSRGYFDAGDYVKYGQPAANTISILAWAGVEFGHGLELAGSLEELKNAVRWGTDYILSAATHIHQDCTYYAQVGRGAALDCHESSCKYDHGYWGRPEDYASYEFAHQRRTYKIDAQHPGNEVWAAAAAALAAAHVLLVDDDFAYSAQLLGVSRALL
jgi:endoglucanase